LERCRGYFKRILVDFIKNGGEDTILSKHDGWTVTTKDKSLSAQFEHTIGVTETGYEIFTKSAKGLDYPNLGI
jgi:methionyl aminopeptidase